MTTLLARHARARPDGLAFVDDARSTTWAEADRRIDGLVSWLRDLGLKPGDRVALLCTNRIELFETVVGCFDAGFVLVPVNWHLTTSEIRYILENAAPAVVVVEEQFAAVVRRILDADRDLLGTAMVIVGGAADSGLRGLPFDEVAQTEPSASSESRAGTVMYYTSGTTGRPKGVVYTGEPPSLKAMSETADGFCALFGIPDDGVTLVCGPAYHSAQLSFAQWPLVAGRTTVIEHRFDAGATLATIDRHRVTNSHMVPTQFVRFLRLDPETRARFDGSSLVCVIHGAAACPPEVKRQMIAWWGPKLVEYYGSTETGLVSIATSAEWLERPGTVGRPWRDQEIQILHGDGQRATPGEVGQVWIVPKDGHDFAYLDDPSKTADAHQGPGAMSVGDVGYVDEDGYLFLTDRNIDMIISGGVNIYPAEIEGVLMAHELVLDAAVYGVADEEYGERVRAAVQLVEDATASADLRDELLQLCRAQLAGFKVPGELQFHESLPRNATGKLNKRELREAAS